MFEPELVNKKEPFIAAVIVVFNDYESLIALIDSLVSQVNAVVIIDNSEEGYEVPDAVLSVSGIIYQRSASNKGLAAGINDGIRLSKKLDAKWLILLDQDSIVSAGMVGCMLDKYFQSTNMTKIGMICPDVYLPDKGSHLSPLFFGFFNFKKINSPSDNVDFCVTSGSMVKMSLFDDVGYMEESFFIDYIDFDFCLRLRSFGYKILYVAEAILVHRLGECRKNKMGIRYTFHSPKRVYFQTRNRLIVVRRYGLHYPLFTIMQLSLFVLKFFKILVIEDRKILRLQYYFSGFLDSFRKQYYSP